MRVMGKIGIQIGGRSGLNGVIQFTGVVSETIKNDEYYGSAWNSGVVNGG